MNLLLKSIFWLDERTTILEKIETKRADWFERTFDLQRWIPQDSKVLDIGSGVGDVTSRLRKYTSGEIFGIDLIDYRRRGIKERSDYEFIVTDGTHLPFKDASFDRITLFWTLHHAKDPTSVLSEAMRVLNAGGEIIIIEDVVEKNKSAQKWFTHIYDRVINLDYDHHPHSNKSLQEWIDLVMSNFTAKIQEAYTIGFSPLKLLEFGVLRFLKDV